MLICPQTFLNGVRFQSKSPLVVRNFQEEQHSFWLQRAEQLRAKSLSQLRAVADSVLRAHLLRNVQDQDSLVLGTFPLNELWREILEASSSKDVSLVDSMLHGFPLMGALDKGHESIKNPMPDSFDDTGHLAYRAWCARQRV